MSRKPRKLSKGKPKKTAKKTTKRPKKLRKAAVTKKGAAVKAGNVSKRKKRPRAIPDPAGEMEIVTVTLASVRKQAGFDYITDPDNRSMAYHYEREDRNYQKQVSLRGFTKWGGEDRWHERRIEFWEEIEERVLAGFKEEIIHERFKRLQKMKRQAEHMEEYLMPMRDEDGKLRRYPKDHEWAGLPMFALELPKYDRFVKTYLELLQSIRLDSGEALNRVDQMPKRSGTPSALDPIGATVDLTEEEASSLARQLVKQRFKKQLQAANDLDHDALRMDGRDDEGDYDDDDSL